MSKTPLKEPTPSEAIAALKRSPKSKIYATLIPTDGAVRNKKRYLNYVKKELLTKLETKNVLLVVMENPRL